MSSAAVVAGVSTMDSRPVVRWAAAEAAARHVELRLVTAAPDRHASPGVTAGWVLAAEVAACWPGLAVTTDVVGGPPAVVLRAAAADADLLVVGGDDVSPFMEAIKGSVSGELLTTAPCSVGVVPRREWTTPAPTPVAVGLDEPTTADTALAYAFAAAARAGRPVTVICCAPYGGADVAHALTGFGELYPDVVVTVEEAVGDPEVRLAAASRAAALLVLGSRSRFVSWLFGSVSRNLIRRGHCPVVIAREPVVAAVPAPRDHARHGAEPYAEPCP